MKFTFDQTTKWWNAQAAKRMSAAVVLRQHDSVLMVKAHYRDSWTFPGGVVDENESPLQAVIRETHEEVGLELDEAQLRLLATSYRHAYCGRQDKIYNFFLYDIHIKEDAEIVMQPDEIEACEWVAVQDIASRADNLRDYEKIQDVLLGYSKQAYWDWEHAQNV